MIKGYYVEQTYSSDGEFHIYTDDGLLVMPEFDTEEDAWAWLEEHLHPYARAI